MSFGGEGLRGPEGAGSPPKGGGAEAMRPSASSISLAVVLWIAFAGLMGFLIASAPEPGLWQVAGRWLQ